MKSNKKIEAIDITSPDSDYSMSQVNERPVRYARAIHPDPPRKRGKFPRPEEEIARMTKLVSNISLMSDL